MTLLSILPRTSAWCAYTEVQTSRPPAGAATPTVPSPFPCIVVDKEVEAFRSFAPFKISGGKSGTSNCRTCQPDNSAMIKAEHSSDTDP